MPRIKGRDNTWGRLVVSWFALFLWALKTVSPKPAARVIRIPDMLFLSALSVMTLAGFIMVYTIW